MQQTTVGNVRVQYDGRSVTLEGYSDEDRLSVNHEQLESLVDFLSNLPAEERQRRRGFRIPRLLQKFVHELERRWLAQRCRGMHSLIDDRR